VLAIGVEVERAALDKLFPPQRSRGRRRGHPLIHDWEGAKQHIDACVVKQGPFPETKLVVREMADYFGRAGKSSPTESAIYAWLRKHPQPGWVKLL
jgi:hypothetical protein